MTVNYFSILFNKNSMANAWISFLKSWRAKHKGVSMKSAMKQAAVEWRKKKGNGSEEPKKKRRKRKK